MKLLLQLIIGFSCFRASADEGMWLLNQFPKQQVQSKYHFNVSDEWLQHVQLSAARLAGGCSASFVSANGLVMTNHHCAHSCIEQLSKPNKDYVASGFYANDAKDEVKCPEIEVNQLTQITDVSQEISRATTRLEGKAFNEKLKSTMTAIENNCAGNDDHIRCDVVSLFHGGKYHLYKYRRYQDVRLVFAPEFATAFFGGDPDNFMFPRYDFDISFLRVYENNQPLKTTHFFPFAKQGAKEGDLSFVAGHPGKTSRLLSYAELEFYRDVQLYDRLITLSELRGLLTEFGERGSEQKRTAKAMLFGIENSLKAMKGHLLALKDKNFMNAKLKKEQAFRQKVATQPNWKKKYGNVWTDLEKAHANLKAEYTRLTYVEWTNFGSKLYGFAKNLVRASDEYPKPNEKRFREFRDSNRPQVKMLMTSKAPIHEELEIETMTFYLTQLRAQLGADDAVVQDLLGKTSPRELATKLVKNTKLTDLKYRQELFDGGAKAIAESKDPLIQFFKKLDPYAREIRKNYEDNIESVITQNEEKLAQADFAIKGDKSYPDATFSLRLSYGQVKGFEKVPATTQLAGAFKRHTGQEPFALPESWLKAQSQIDAQVALNFCTDNDIIGGNSGSPVINQNAEITGLIFDGNIHSLGGNFAFDPVLNRAVAVHSDGIKELLKNVYHADRILKDLDSP